MSSLTKLSFTILALGLGFIAQTTFAQNSGTPYANSCVNCVHHGFYYCTDNSCNDENTYNGFTQTKKDTCAKTYFKCKETAEAYSKDVVINDIPITDVHQNTLKAGKAMTYKVYS